ncbi:MAG: HpcH/HpaI aldolase family protein [Bacillota bacterium]
MANAVPKLKKLIKEGKVAVGTWAQMASAEAVEMVGSAYFDFVVIDTEHGHFGLDTALHMVRAAEASGTAPLIRISEKNPTLILKALDMGAQGIVVPGVSTKEDAEMAVKAARYAPAGDRGACPYIRAAGHTARDWGKYATDANENSVVCLLVEGAEGAANFEEIVAVPGVDAVMIGPFDLSVSLGVGGQVTHPLVVEKLEQMAGIAKKNGVALAGVIFELAPARIKQDIERWMKLGSSVLMVGGDKMFLASAFRNAAEVAATFKRQ